jgi:hypothetical protein
MSLVVHFMGYGMTACQMAGVPKEWPQGHRWSSDWEDVTCQSCLKGKEPIDTYVIAPDGKSITCKRCGRTSYNSGDVEQRWCEYCHVSHDDIWPPSRLWWINYDGELMFILCKCGYRLGIRKRDAREAAVIQALWKKVGCPQCREKLKTESTPSSSKT